MTLLVHENENVIKYKKLFSNFSSLYLRERNAHRFLCIPKYTYITTIMYRLVLYIPMVEKPLQKKYYGDIFCKPGYGLDLW